MAVRRGVMICLEGGAPAAARGVRGDVALATVPNMFAKEAPAAALGVLFALARCSSWLRLALKTTATVRPWVGFEKAFLRHGVAMAPGAARGGVRFWHVGEPKVAGARFLRGVASSQVPNKEPNDVDIIHPPP